MKNALLLSLSLCMVLAGKAQETKKTDEEPKKEIESNCYLKWENKFENRKAYDVEDGAYEDVIITFRHGSSADCFNGKAEVKTGKITACYIKMEDGSFEIVKKKWRYEPKDIAIINGISQTMITIDDELINVLFVKKIMPKKKGYVKAEDPKDD